MTLSAEGNHGGRLFLITVDGFAGTGKGTASMMLAKRLGYICLDTGAMYRAVALCCHRAGLSPDDRDAIVSLLPTISLSFANQGGSYTILVNGEDVSPFLRIPEVDNIVSQISKISEVRDFLIYQQQRLGSQGGLVADGRDMGSVVFPFADYKFLLTCDSGIRARRRQTQLGESSIFQSLDEIEQNIQMRDALDARHLDVLVRKYGDEVIRLDTGLLSADDVLALMVSHVLGTNH